MSTKLDPKNKESVTIDYLHKTGVLSVIVSPKHCAIPSVAKAFNDDDLVTPKDLLEHYEAVDSSAREDLRNSINTVIEAQGYIFELGS